VLHGHLLLAHARGRRTLIVVDEAQALSIEVIEQLRLLTNLVTSDRKLVQVLLIGQPELLERCSRRRRWSRWRSGWWRASPAGAAAGGDATATSHTGCRWPG
jgi:type II secretory pathway predicted ATPase ExeA